MCYIRVRTAKDIETIANGDCGGRLILEFLRDKIGLTPKDPEMDLADDSGNLLFLSKLSPTCNGLQVLNPRALYFPVLITEKPELKLEYLVKAPNVGGVWKSRGPLLKLKHHWEKFHTACVRQGGKLSDEEAIVVIQRLASGRMPFSGRTRLSNRPPSVAAISTKPSQPEHVESSKSGEVKQQSKESPVFTELQGGAEGSQVSDTKSEAQPGKRSRSSSAERVQVSNTGEQQDTSSKSSDFKAEANEGVAGDEKSRSKMIRFDLEVKTDGPGPEDDAGNDVDGNKPETGETESLDSRGNGRKQGVIESSEETTNRDGRGTGSTERAKEVTSTTTHTEKSGSQEVVSHKPQDSNDPGKDEKQTELADPMSRVSNVSEVSAVAELAEIPMEIQQNDEQATRSDSRAAANINNDPAEGGMDKMTDSTGESAKTGSKKAESLQRPKQSSEGINPNENSDGNGSQADEGLIKEGNAEKKSDRSELKNNELIMENPSIDNSKAASDEYAPKNTAGRETPIEQGKDLVDVDANSSPLDTSSPAPLPERGQKRAPYMGYSTNEVTQMQDNLTDLPPLTSYQPNDRVQENYQFIAEMKTNSDQLTSSRTQLTISGMEVKEVERWNEPPYKARDEKDIWFNEWKASREREDAAYNTSRMSHARPRTAMESVEEQNSRTYDEEQGGFPWPVRGQQNQDLTAHWSDMLCSAICPDQQLENIPTTVAKDTDQESHKGNTSAIQEFSGRTYVSFGDTNIENSQQSLVKDGSVVTYPLAGSNWRSSRSDEVIARKIGEVPIASTPSDPAQSWRDGSQEGLGAAFESAGQTRSSQAAAPSRLPTEAESSDSLDVQYSPPSSRHDTPSVLGASLKHLDQLLREKHVSVSVSVVKRAESIQLGERECSSKRAWERGKNKTAMKKDTAALAENERIKKASKRELAGVSRSDSAVSVFRKSSDEQKMRMLSDYKPTPNPVAGAQSGQAGGKVRDLERIKKASKRELAGASRSDSTVSVFRKSSDEQKIRMQSDYKPTPNPVAGAQSGQAGGKVRELEKIKKANKRELAGVSRSDSAVSAFRKSSDLLQNERDKEDIRRTVSVDSRRPHTRTKGTLNDDEENSNHKQATTDNKLAPDLALGTSKNGKNKTQSQSRRRTISAHTDDIHLKAPQKLKHSQQASVDKETKKHARGRRSSAVDPSHDKDELHSPDHSEPTSTSQGTQKKKEGKHLENKDEHKLRKDVADYHSRGRRKTRAETHAHSAESDLTAPLGDGEEKPGLGSRRKTLGGLAKMHPVGTDATHMKLGDPSLLSGVDNKDGVLQRDKSKSSQQEDTPKNNVNGPSSGITGSSKAKKGKDTIKAKKVPISSKVSKIPRKLKKSKTEDKSLANIAPSPEDQKPEKPKLMSSASLLRKALKCPPPPPPPQPDAETDRRGRDPSSHRRSSARRSQANARQEPGARPQLVLVGSISAADLAAKVSIPQLTQEERDQYQIRPGIWMVTEKIA